MSARVHTPGSLARALPAMLRIGWKDAVAYRTEMLVWMLTMTLPLIMLALFRAVAEEGAIGGFDARGFTAYFLSTLIVRQLASSWIVWEMNQEIRQGTMALRLLRPIHPLWSYLCGALAAIPVRALISVPFAVGLLYAIEGTSNVPLARGPLAIAMFLVSLTLAFLLAFAFSAIFGALALYFESSIGLWHVYISFYALLSGYLVPLQLFPAWLRQIAMATPFPYLQALPVEFLLGLHEGRDALQQLGLQLLWTGGTFAVLLLLWSHAQKRFGAYGG